MVADVCLFDEAMFHAKPSEVAHVILNSFISNSSLENGNEKLALSLKWMLERCEEYTEWLLGNATYKV